MKLSKPIVSGAVVLVIVAIAASGAAQEKGRGNFGRGGFRGAFGGGASLTRFATIEVVQKDIGVSKDVAEKLNSLSEDYSAAVQKEYRTANIRLQDFQNQSNEERRQARDKMAKIDATLNDEFNPKLKALISEDQFNRLKQIQLQANLADRGPGALTYADVASELKLTDEQKKKLDEAQTALDEKRRELFTGGGSNREAAAKLREERSTKTMEVLTAEQKEKLTALKGPAFDVSQLNLGFGGRQGKGN